MHIVMQVIDLGDHMEFEKDPYSTKDTLICSDPTIPSDESNLVIKVCGWHYLVNSLF